MANPIVERIEVRLKYDRTPFSCMAICNDGTRVVLPITGVSKSVKLGEPSSDKAALEMYGFRVHILEPDTGMAFDVGDVERTYSATEFYAKDAA